MSIYYLPGTLLGKGVQRRVRQAIPNSFRVYSRGRASLEARNEAATRHVNKYMNKISDSEQCYKENIGDNVFQSRGEYFRYSDQRSLF